MAETKSPVAEPKTSFTVFRNPKDMIYYLKRRPHQADSEPNFLLGPGMTVEAMDQAEETLLLAMGLVDVKKETPALSSSMDAMFAELQAEKAKNRELLAEKAELEKKIGKTEDVAPVKASVKPKR